LKLQKLAPKQYEITGMAFSKPERCRRICSTRPRHWRHVGPRAAADIPEHQLDLTLLRLLFHSAPPVRSNVTCKEEEKRKQSLGSSPFSNLFLFMLSLFVSVFLLLVSPALF
jgi:hypothetical protein